MTIVVFTVWWFVAASTAIGGVVFVLPGQGHGVHEGDLWALILAIPPVVLSWLATRPVRR